MRLIYTCGPFRADTAWEIEQNIRVAERAAAMLWQEGYGVMCPHTNSRFFHGLVADVNFLNADLRLLRACDGIILLPRWELSEGARIEYAEARGYKKDLYRYRPYTDTYHTQSYEETDEFLIREGLPI
jgi:hypothetical protein